MLTHTHTHLLSGAAACLAGWSQGVFLKSAGSIALPLFQMVPDAKLVIDGASKAATD